MRNYFKFGRWDSRDFGVFIARDGVYNAPPRQYEAISVPGRNGDLLFPRNRMENIEVRYPCLIYKGFDSNLSDFRSALVSINGYARIEDSYHPDEFRLGYLVDGVDVNPRVLGDGGTFDIVFNCKPQRFLKSGEVPITYPPGADYHSKNLLPYPYDGVQTQGNLTYTDYGDGTIGVNGTTRISTYTLMSSELELEDGEEYILSGCPEGGAANHYSLNVSTSGAAYVDSGNGMRFTYSASLPITGAYIYIGYSGGDTTVDNLTFKPMIRKASDPPGWEAYTDGATQIYNPTLFESKPLIRIACVSSGTLVIGDNIITVKPDARYNYIYIDSETQNCYSGVGDIIYNVNSLVSFASGEFPTIKPGVSDILFNQSYVYNVQITPRWYRL